TAVGERQRVERLGRLSLQDAAGPPAAGDGVHDLEHGGFRLAGDDEVEAVAEDGLRQGGGVRPAGDEQGVGVAGADGPPQVARRAGRPRSSSTVMSHPSNEAVPPADAVTPEPAPASYRGRAGTTPPPAPAGAASADRPGPTTPGPGPRPRSVR